MSKPILEAFILANIWETKEGNRTSHQPPASFATMESQSVRHHHRNGLADLKLVAKYYEANCQAFASNHDQSYQPPPPPPHDTTLHGQHLNRSSLNSESSAPGLVEDRADSDVSADGDYEYHAAGTELWDSFWKAQAQDEDSPYYEEHPSPMRGHQVSRQYEDRTYHEAWATSPTRRGEQSWPLPDTRPIHAQKNWSGLRSVASYSLFPRQTSVAPPRTTSLSSFGLSPSPSSLASHPSHSRDFSQSRTRPPPLPLYQTTLDPTFVTRTTGPGSNPITPPLPTSQSDPTPVASPPRPPTRTAPLAPLAPLRPFRFLQQDPHPVSVFEDSDDEDQGGLAARLVRGLHKRSASETRRSARGGEMAAAQLRRARAGTVSIDANQERGRSRPGSSSGEVKKHGDVFGRMLGRRSRQ